MRQLKIEQGNVARKVVANFDLNQMSRVLLRMSFDGQNAWRGIA